MRLFNFFIKFAASSTFGLAIMVAMAWIYLEASLPSVNSLKDVKLQVPLKIMSREGDLIAEFGEKRRIPIKLNEVPKALIQAILATEDRRFYEHLGVDFRGMARASYNLITKANRDQGGSTITMQVARNIYLTRKKTFARKINEILLAFKIEAELSKDEILELYLNIIYLGKRAYGVAAAAEVYYGCTVKDLNLAQIAMIAGLPQAPSSINPLHSPEHALKRRRHVLERMLNYQYIDAKEFHTANNSPLQASYHAKTVELEASHVADMVRQDLLAKYGEDIYGSGFQVWTSISSPLQKAANSALRRNLLEYDKRHGYRSLSNWQLPPNLHSNDENKAHWLEILNKTKGFGPCEPAIVTSLEFNKAWVLLKSGKYLALASHTMAWAMPKDLDNPLPKDILKIGDLIMIEPLKNNDYGLSQLPEVEGALVALNPKTGALVALTGGFDYQSSHFNRAVQASRQAGSNFKPFVYTLALENGFTLASRINDAPLVFDDGSNGLWRPNNDSDRYFGPTRLRVSLARSQNTVAIRLLQWLKIPNMIKLAKKFGFQAQHLPPYLSLALGSGAVTPLQLASAYSVFANQGQKATPYWIEKIVDEQGRPIFSHQTPKAPAQVTDPQTAYLMTSALQGAIQNGTGRRALGLKRQDLAGKTGTTNDKLDAWYSGFSPNLVATAWLGFDKLKSLEEYASQAALPMWMYFMDAALKDQPVLPFEQPEDIVSVRIDPNTGLLARSGQEDAIYELFKSGSAPSEVAPELSLDAGTNEHDSLY